MRTRVIGSPAFTSPSTTAKGPTAEETFQNSELAKFMAKNRAQDFVAFLLGLCQAGADIQ
jgi:hypothetical protein